MIQKNRKFIKGNLSEDSFFYNLFSKIQYFFLYRFNLHIYLHISIQ